MAVRFYVHATRPGYDAVALSGDFDDVTAGDPYTGSLTVTGGTGTYSSVNVVAGAIPTGSTVAIVSNVPTISGTSVEGSYSVDLTVTDSLGNVSNTLTVTVVVSAAATLEIWNSADKNANITLSASDRTATLTTAPGTWCVARGLTGKNSGKWYVRGGMAGTIGAQGQILGLCTSGMGLTSAIGLVANSVGIQGNSSTASTRLFSNGSVSSPYTFAPSNAVPAIAVDFDAGKAWLRSHDSYAWAGGGDPAAGTTPSYTFTPGTTLYVGVSIFEGAQSVTLPASSGDVSETIPSGFSLWTQ